jgi:uncharacterized protein (TIGR01244 family)
MERRRAVTLLLVAALCVTGASHMSATQPTPAGIVNFSRVNATVACGGATEPSALAALAAEGFKSVINLRLGSEPGVADEAGVVEKAGLTYIHLPMDPMAPEDATAEQFLEAIANPAHQPVYVHCASANRVGAVWAIKRVVQDGWPRDRAIAEGEAIGMKSPAMLAFVNRFLDARK